MLRQRFGHIVNVSSVTGLIPTPILNLFPVFSHPDRPSGEPLTIKTILAIRPLEVRDFGKLLVWEFVSGYSERFVTGILETLESKK